MKRMKKIGWFFIILLNVAFVFSLFFSLEENKMLKGSPVLTLVGEVEEKKKRNNGNTKIPSYAYFLKINGEEYVVDFESWRNIKKDETYTIKYKDVKTEFLFKKKGLKKVTEIAKINK